MKKMIIVFTLAIALAAGAADITQGELKTLSAELSKLCRESNLPEALKVIDRSYSYDNTANLPPTLWAADEHFRNAVKLRFAAAGILPEQLLQSLAAGLKTPQAKFELYNAYAKILREQLESSSTEKFDRDILRLRDEVVFQRALLADGKISREKCDESVLTISDKIDLLRTQKDGTRTRETADEIWQLYQTFLQDKSITPFVGYYALIASAEQYCLVLTRKKARKVLDILSRRLGWTSPTFEQERSIMEMKVKALLELGRGREALPLIEKLLAHPEEDQPRETRIFYLICKGNAMLQLKKEKEVNEIIEYLKTANITADYLKREFGLLILRTKIQFQ